MRCFFVFTCIYLNNIVSGGCKIRYIYKCQTKEINFMNNSDIQIDFTFLHVCSLWFLFNNGKSKHI